MPWTYQQRIQRACRMLVDRNLLDESQIHHLKRPLYFGKYAFSMGFSPNAHYWFRFDDLKAEIMEGLKGRDCHVVANHSTMDYYVFSSDVSVIRWIATHSSPYTFSYLRVVDEACWHLPKARNKQKSKFFNLYGWRVAVRDGRWFDEPRNQEFLAGLSGEYKVHTPPVFYRDPKTFLYLANKNDVLLFKIMAAEHILSIEDRSTL